ncbi:hypothetical protein SEVIR_6G201366v4 [Setaria viridis]
MRWWRQVHLHLPWRLSLQRPEARSPSLPLPICIATSSPSSLLSALPSSDPRRSASTREPMAGVELEQSTYADVGLCELRRRPHRPCRSTQRRASCFWRCLL